MCVKVLQSTNTCPKLYLEYFSYFHKKQEQNKNGTILTQSIPNYLAGNSTFVCGNQSSYSEYQCGSVFVQFTLSSKIKDLFFCHAQHVGYSGNAFQNELLLEKLELDFAPNSFESFTTLMARTFLMEDCSSIT